MIAPAQPPAVVILAELYGPTTFGALVRAACVKVTGSRGVCLLRGAFCLNVLLFCCENVV